MKPTPAPYLRDGATVYALTESTERRRRGMPQQVNRFSAQVQGGGTDGAPADELEAVACLFQKAPEMADAIRALLRDSEARPGAYMHVRGLEALRAALPEEATDAE